MQDIRYKTPKRITTHSLRTTDLGEGTTKKSRMVGTKAKTLILSNDEVWVSFNLGAIKQQKQVSAYLHRLHVVCVCGTVCKKENRKLIDRKTQPYIHPKHRRNY